LERQLRPQRTQVCLGVFMAVAYLDHYFAVMPKMGPWRPNHR
jgi:hypothetical protein